jgi:tRNA threonylcarbamoyladenosine biosynthesis protein TsaE
MSLSFTHVCIRDLSRVARQIIHTYPTSRVFAFFGEMGSGKTTLIKYLCHVLNVTHTIQSPTFAIVNEYTTVNQQKVFHFDFYRIKNISEAVDIGLDDYLYSGCYCFLEWTENIVDLLPDRYLKIDIIPHIDLTRTIVVTPIA